MTVEHMADIALVKQLYVHIYPKHVDEIHGDSWIRGVKYYPHTYRDTYVDIISPHMIV